MLMEVSVRAEELFPADAEAIDVNGARVRKGTIAAFAHNARVLEQADAASDEYAQALADLHELAPILRTAGMFEVFSVTLPRAAKIVAESGDVDPGAGDGG
jgi:uncharacterized protein YlxW (UPF0749 family)